MRAIVCEGSGGPEVLRWREVPDATPGAGEVLLEVAATSVNRADLLQREGRYPPPPGASPLLGLEAAGRVRVGAGEWRAGDEVMALLGGGGYAELAAADARHVAPVPRAIGLPDAGGVMETFCTVTLNLLVLGELRAGQRVLIHGGGGGIGTAAIQVARRAGAEVWVTAGGPEKVARCRALGAHEALDYRVEAFSERVREAGGADLILDVMGAKYLEANLRALAPDGRLVVIGLQGGVRAELDLLTLLSRRLAVVGSTLRALSRERKAEVVARFRRDVWPALDAGELAVVVDSRRPLPEAADAHRRVAGYEHVGKVLLVTSSATA